MYAAGYVTIPCGAIQGHGELLHWDGMSWSVVPPPDAAAGRGDWTTVTGTGPRDVWALGYTIRQWDGISWTRHDPPGGFIARRMWAANPDDAWAVGAGGGVIHWDGTRFTASATDSNVAFTSVFGTWRDDVWAVGDGGTIMRFVR